MKRAFLLILSAVLLCGCGGGKASVTSPLRAEELSTGSDKGYSAVNYSYIKAVWLSQYDLYDILTCNGNQREVREFTDMISKVLDNVRAMGLNTVIVQVRPFGDSFYPSDYYPMSAYAVGRYGEQSSYDAFKVILNEAHRRGLSVHAWINPLRAMRTDEIEDIDSADYVVKAWYDSYDDRVSEVSGRLYLNPAYEEVRELVCNGAAEIVGKYDVDGIHIDDYFYPTTDVGFDAVAYETYLLSGGELLLEDFRREQINKLVSGIYSAVKDENDSVLFGVSPSGVMKNNYEQLYADVAKWCAEEGYLDYVCPQIYFGFEHSTCPFDRVLDEFVSIVEKGKAKLVVGLSLGKAAEEYDPYAGVGKYEWRDNKDIIKRSLETVLATERCDGISLFSYRLFYDPVSGEEVEGTAKERGNFLPLLKIK